MWIIFDSLFQPFKVFTNLVWFLFFFPRAFATFAWTFATFAWAFNIFARSFRSFSIVAWAFALFIWALLPFIWAFILFIWSCLIFIWACLTLFLIFFLFLFFVRTGILLNTVFTHAFTGIPLAVRWKRTIRRRVCFRGRFVRRLYGKCCASILFKQFLVTRSVRRLLRFVCIMCRRILRSIWARFIFVRVIFCAVLVLLVPVCFVKCTLRCVFVLRAFLYFNSLITRIACFGNVIILFLGVAPIFLGAIPIFLVVWFLLLLVARNFRKRPTVRNAWRVLPARKKSWILCPTNATSFGAIEITSPGCRIYPGLVMMTLFTQILWWVISWRAAWKVGANWTLYRVVSNRVSSAAKKLEIVFPRRKDDFLNKVRR